MKNGQYNMNYTYNIIIEKMLRIAAVMVAFEASLACSDLDDISLPGNVFEYGKQYSFHIGQDLSSVYRQITFTHTISEWETKIYENNDDFKWLILC